MFLHLLGGEGLSDVASCPARYGLYHVGFAAFGGNHDHGHTLCVGYSRELLDELQPIHYRHIDVAEYEIDGTRLKDNKRLGSVSGLKYLGKIDAGLPQRALHDLAHD